MQSTVTQALKMSGDAVVVERLEDQSSRVRRLDAGGAEAWSSPVEGQVNLGLGALYSGVDSVVALSADAETIRVTQLSAVSGASDWSATIPATLVPGSTGLPATVAGSSMAVIVAQESSVWGVDRANGVVWSHENLPVDGASRRVEAIGPWVAALDTQRLRVWSVTGESVLDEATYANAQVVLADRVLWRGTDRVSRGWTPQSGAQTIELPGRLRPGGWSLPDGSVVVALHGVDGGIALARIQPDLSLAWVSPVQGEGFVGEGTASTGSGRVPFVVQAEGGQHRVVAVSVATGEVTSGEAVRLPSLIDMERRGGPALAGLVGDRHALVLSSESVVAMSSEPVAGLSLYGERVTVWSTTESTFQPLLQPGDPSVFGWNIADSGE